jgi:hypothetical protein
MQKRESDLMDKDGIVEVDKAFCARINASVCCSALSEPFIFFLSLFSLKVVKDAEEYYRGMFTRKNTWSIRIK